MRTREEVLMMLHRQTRGAHSDNTLGNLPVLVKDLLAVLEFCQVIVSAPSSVVVKDGMKR